MFENPVPSSSPAKSPAAAPVATASQNVSFAGGASSSAPAIKMVVVAVIALLILGGLGFFIYKMISRASTPKVVKTETPVATSTGLDLASTSTPSLPGSGSIGLETDAGLADNQRIEYLSFADFYVAPVQNYQAKWNDYNLPINIKTDVLNYYDVSRKLDIDSSLSNLNNLGFAIINNNLKTVDDKNLPADDFFSAYKSLNNLGLPLFFTSDFVTYYYQNQIKKIFKDVEKNVFYNNLWDICSKMFEVARNRYNQRLAQVGNINDPILEGARMEMAYFATALEILQPSKDQISLNPVGGDKEFFSRTEADFYKFTAPEYLKIDVEREVELIREHGQKIKSPVLLYTTDYKDFVLPEDYINSSKLSNFYLTTRWLNSPFPAYYQGADCPDCSLDIDDWRVRMVAANYIAQDLFNDYYLKAKWAGIYKVLGYFKGLRGGLTFVSVRDALSEVFGAEAKVEDLFDSKNPEMPNNFKKLQDKILTHSFGDIEGAYKKDSAANPNKVGAALLLEPYWPNDYIFGELSYPAVGVYNAKFDKKPNNTTACTVNNEVRRCNGFGLDVINLVHPISGNNYFTENTNYKNYLERAAELKNKISYIQSNWNYNNFWSNLKVLQTSLGSDRALRPVFARNDNWDRKEIDRALAAWVNLQLPADVFTPYKEKAAGMGTSNDYFKNVEYAYVEPNVGLFDELIANAEMIDKMFQALKIYNDVSSASSDLKDLLYRLQILKTISLKELNGEILSSDEYQFLDKLAKEYEVKTDSSKSFVLTGKNGSAITESAANVRLILAVQKRGDSLILNVGPIFNYWEKK